MIILYNFEVSSLPTSLIKQNKNIAHATKFEALMILCSSNISHPLTWSKTWGKGPKGLKILKLELFSQV